MNPFKIKCTEAGCNIECNLLSKVLGVRQSNLFIRSSVPPDIKYLYYELLPQYGR